METLDGLNAIALEKNNVRMEKLNAMRTYVEATLTSFIPASLAAYAKVCNVNDSHAAISVTLPKNNRYREIDLYYHSPWLNENRKLELNFGCFGSFVSNDIFAIKYCEVLAVFASHLDEIEQKLLFSDEGKKVFAEYKAASNESWKADDAVKQFKADQDAKILKAKKADILSRIAVGAKIVIGKDCYSKPIVLEIEQITPKNVVLEGSYGRRTKKNVLVDNIVCGKWKFIAA